MKIKYNVIFLVQKKTELTFDMSNRSPEQRMKI